MITWLTGRPGSGKSYRAVYQLLRLEVQDKFFIVHEVEGLNADFFNVPSCVRTVEQVRKSYDIEVKEFFTLDFQKRLCADAQEKFKRPVLLVIDECWRYLGREKKACDVDREEAMAWLAMHRHLGQDIWLMCQTKDQLYTPVQGLVRERVHAKKGMLLDRFAYDHFEGDEKLRTSFLPKSKKIFEAYKSFEIAAVKPARSYKLHVLVLVGVIACAFFINWVRDPLSKSKKVLATSTAEAKTIETKGVVSKASKVSPEKVAKGPRPGPDHGLEGWSLVGVLGDRVLVRSVDGGAMVSLAEIVDFKLLDGDSKRAKVMIAGKVVTLSRIPVALPVDSSRSEETSERRDEKTSLISSVPGV